MGNKTLPKAACILCIHPTFGYVLAATRRGTTDQWGLIGGKVDPNETPVEAAHREFQEETGVTLVGPIVEFYNAAEDCVVMNDDSGYEVHVFTVAYELDKQRIMDRFKPLRDPIEVEPGIFVGFVPYTELLKGPFKDFNEDLLHIMLAKGVIA